MTRAEQARNLKLSGLSTREIAKRLCVGDRYIRRITSGVAPQTEATPANPTAKFESFQEQGDTATATSQNTTIKTLEGLLTHMKVDLSVWEVERHVVNKWEVVMREPATTVGGRGSNAVLSESKHGARSTLWTRGSHVPLHEEMFQVKAWLRRKTASQRGLEAILKRIESGAPILPPVKRPKPAASHRRSLELCIMDPHLGLLCQYPEADAPWDLELAAGTIMQAIDDLVEKAKPFGPFVEVFAPFGNDFVHCDTVFHETTAGTPQPEAISWHRVYDFAESVAIAMVERLRKVAPVRIYEIPGNHSRIADFTLARLIRAYFRNCSDVKVDASSSPYKFHQAGVNLIGYEHGHSVAPIRLAALMANECRSIWHKTEYREWHLADQHRKGSPRMFMEEQGVSIEFIQGITAPNEWHRIKSFSHQKRGAVGYVWDWKQGPVARIQHNISQYSHKPLVET